MGISAHCSKKKLSNSRFLSIIVILAAALQPAAPPLGENDMRLLDVEKVRIDNPASGAVLDLAAPLHPLAVFCDGRRVGGSTGGTSAAVAGAQPVCMSA